MPTDHDRCLVEMGQCTLQVKHTFLRDRRTFQQRSQYAHIKAKFR